MKPTSFWDQVVFSDEKRFCLDGPDGSTYYWSDPRLEDRYFSKHPRGGDGFMVWAGVCALGSTSIVLVQGNMDGIACSNMIGYVLMPFIEEKYILKDRDVIFQQDNAPAHTAKKTKDMFLSEGLDVLPWPAKSVDLNIIENIWGWLVRRVSHGFRQFETVEVLKQCITFEWEKLSNETIIKYVDSMPRRCRDVVLARGGPTKY